MAHHSPAPFMYFLRQAAPDRYGLWVAEVVGAPPSLTILEIEDGCWSYTCIDTGLEGFEFDSVEDAYFDYKVKARKFYEGKVIPFEKSKKVKK